MKRWLAILGRIYLAIAGCVILLSYASIWYFQGFQALQEVMSPFNVINFAAIALTLAPGFIMLHFAGRDS